jgi:septal ring factor EnvC (AmiA/AmiB activator)
MRSAYDEEVEKRTAVEERCRCLESRVVELEKEVKQLEETNRTLNRRIHELEELIERYKLELANRPTPGSCNCDTGVNPQKLNIILRMGGEPPMTVLPTPGQLNANANQHVRTRNGSRDEFCVGLCRKSSSSSSIRSRSYSRSRNNPQLLTN